jgi:hypothetical protein
MSGPSFVRSEGGRQWMLRYLDIKEYRAKRDARLTKAARASTGERTITFVDGVRWL